ncbi:MAG: hypothetical protein WCK55_17105, partial [Verrucomicrobiota bacterium]
DLGAHDAQVMALRTNIVTGIAKAELRNPGRSSEASTGSSVVLGRRRRGCYEVAMHGQSRTVPSADTTSIPEADPRSGRPGRGGRESEFHLMQSHPED